ncbi:SEFIR domain-containing protein [Niveibacterium terrae]|uniref:SEFIR domain-containing protein n=1 Tax=Niveibacterium terrae TaxID=3373598 RepID=UPI003A90EDFE
MSSPPRLFISYSWSTSEHEQWVIDLATELVNSGVDVVLDKWDLREGHDSIAFMEKMVTDPSISKVILVCDQVYASKADDRSGGVGTETQIISAEVYAKQSQDKFVAVIAEKSDAGKPYLPAYYKSRIYVDLSEIDRYSENFEKLLRWIFDKPLYMKPEIGKPPSFIIEPDAPALGTSALAKRVIEGIKSEKGYARGALDEYLSLFSEHLERFRIAGGEGEMDDRVVKSIEDFTPSRNELIQIVTALAQYADPQTYVPRIHRFFESLVPYLSRPPQITQWIDVDFDNFKFIVHELFLYSIAVLLRGEHIESATYLLSQPYYVPGNSDCGKNAIVSYTVFREHMKSLDIRNQRLKSNRLSMRADLLEQRSKTSGVLFRYVMQADFVCFLRADLIRTDSYDRWWPETLIYADRHYGPFELFARSVSKTYLSRTLSLLGVASLDELKAKLDEYASGRRNLPRWQFDSFGPSTLLGFGQLGTKV